MRVLDTHAHLDFPQFDHDRESLIASLNKEGIGVITVATDPDSLVTVDTLARHHPLIWGAIGLHPTEITEPVITKIPDLIENWQRLFKANRKLVAIGEIGLDYLIRSIAVPDETALYSRQQLALRQFLTFATEQALPVIFHCRQAYGDLGTIIRDYPNLTGVVHCFSGDSHQARRFLDLGLHLSFTALITYPKNAWLSEVVKLIPLDRLLLETDSPFLPPQAARGSRNDPRTVLQIAEIVAELHRLPLSKVLTRTTENARKLFRLD